MKSNKTNEEIKMMDAADIKYPVKFHLYDTAPKQIIFWSKVSKGVYDTGAESDLKISYFVSMHNRMNPDNKPGIRYYCEHLQCETKHDDLFLGRIGFTDTVGKKMTICDIQKYGNGKVEDMPIGATLLKIKNGDGWDELRLKVRRIEIHDDIITMLSGYAGCYIKGGNTYAAEINIKRGTMVTWQE